MAVWGPGSVRGGGHELGRISLQELANARQVGQLVAFYVLGVHAVKQEGAIQVLDERGLWSETEGLEDSNSSHRPWRGLSGPGPALVTRVTGHSVESGGGDAPLGLQPSKKAGKGMLGQRLARAKVLRH